MNTGLNRFGIVALAIPFFAFSSASHASENPRTLHCLVSKIEVSKWDLYQRDAGTIQELQQVELVCDEDTFAKDQKKAFVTGPLSAAPILQDKMNRNEKGTFLVTGEGYGGDLLAIDSTPVGPLQPYAKPGTRISFTRSERFNDTTLITRIYLTNRALGATEFIAQDTTKLRIRAYSLGGATSPGDGRGTNTGPTRAILDIDGAVELYQEPGDQIAFTGRDSLGISKFLLMTDFPSVMSFESRNGSGAIICEAADQCRLLQN